MQDLIEQFERYFELVPANDEAHLSICKTLRYQVFCLEHQILSPRDAEKAMEQDFYDAHSRHMLLRHRGSGNYAATVRLVLPDTAKRSFNFPIEEQLIQHDDPEFDVIRNAEKSHTAEISRFSVSKNFRRRKGEKELAHGIGESFGQHANSEDRRFDSHITLGLFKAIVRMSAENNIDHWIAFMEPSLIRLLSRVGIKFQKVGPMIHYCGKRYACFENAPAVLVGIKEVRPDIWQFITDSGRYSL